MENLLRTLPCALQSLGNEMKNIISRIVVRPLRNLILALQAYGINSCWVAGEKKPYAESIRTLLGVPEKFTLVSLVAAGCPLELTIATKKEMKQIVFYEEFKKE